MFLLWAKSWSNMQRTLMHVDRFFASVVLQEDGNILIWDFSAILFSQRILFSLRRVQIIWQSKTLWLINSETEKIAGSLPCRNLDWQVKALIFLIHRISPKLRTWREKRFRWCSIFFRTCRRSNLEKMARHGIWLGQITSSLDFNC